MSTGRAPAWPEYEAMATRFASPLPDFGLPPPANEADAGLADPMSPQNESISMFRSPRSPEKEATRAGAEPASVKSQPPPACRGVSAQAAPALPAGGLRRTPERMLSRSGATLSALPNTLSSA